MMNNRKDLGIFPALGEADSALEEASVMNAGPWVAHSKTVAFACRNLAGRCPNLDPDKAFLMGLLHDIGRRVGFCSERHMIEGYRFCMEKGWSGIAPICITHSFMVKDIHSAIGTWDVPEEDVNFVEKFLNDVVYTEYDLLVQLCDSVSMPTGCCLLEKRFMDVTRRYGLHAYTLKRYEALLDIKKHFEDRIGESIYKRLPNVIETTFELKHLEGACML